MIFIYNISISFYSLGIRLAAIGGNSKARLWVNGRRNIFKHISSTLNSGEKRIWFHCASLGEFEQGRPVMDNLKMKYPEYKIVLTFFSPSGYEVRKNYTGADYVFYLPVDTYFNANKFVDLVQPEKAFFIKYEYWHHYFKTLKRKNIPLYIISAIFRKDQSFFKWYGIFFRKMLPGVTQFFVQDEASENLLHSIGFKNVTVSGDTRFDRVATVARNNNKVAIVEKFKNGKKLFIAGSTWPQDEEIIIQLIASKPVEIEKFIIAPHEISGDRIQHLYNKLSAKLDEDKIILYSNANESNVTNATVMIINNIGLLSSLYRYGDFALIGGGFGKGIHNILEAAVFGMPLFFGPHYQKFKEANDLVQFGGAFTINSFTELRSKLNEFSDDKTKWKSVSAISKEYVQEKCGATEKILKFIRITP